MIDNISFLYENFVSEFRFPRRSFETIVRQIIFRLFLFRNNLYNFIINVVHDAGCPTKIMVNSRNRIRCYSFETKTTTIFLDFLSFFLFFTVNHSSIMNLSKHTYILRCKDFHFFISFRQPIVQNKKKFCQLTLIFPIPMLLNFVL